MAKRKLLPGTAVQVHWLDSCGNGDKPDWNSIQEADCNPIEVETIAFFLKETKVAMLLAHSIATNGQSIGLIIIPKGCIQEVDILGKKRSQRGRR